MSKKYFAVKDLKKLASSISNKTSLKILDYLKENESSAVDISKSLNIPLNTVTYSLKNLESSGLIESNYFKWSPKGNKMFLYTLAKKVITLDPSEISMKKEFLKIIPVLALSGIIGYYLDKETVNEVSLKSADLALESSVGIVQETNYGLYLFLVILVLCFFYLLLVYFKKNLNR